MRSVREGAGELVRRLSYLLRRHLLRTPYLTAREGSFGLRFRFRTEDAIGRSIYQKGVYEEELTDLLLELPLRGGDVVLDVGANIGWFSLLLDRRAPDGVSIYAFEPEPLNFGLLSENLELNGAGGVVPIQKAVSDEEGRRSLFVYPDKNRGRHSLAPIPGAAGSVEVPTTTLDRVWRDRGLDGRSVRLLKIDVEGFECAVLRGASEILERCELVVTEYAPELLRRAGDRPEALLELLTGGGFDPYRPGPGGLERMDPAELAGREEPENLVWSRGPPPGPVGRG